jgi:hypothetical protein
MLIGLAAIHANMPGFVVVALGVAAFTYATAVFAGIPTYLLLRSRNWLRWWHFTLGGAALGLLTMLVMGLVSFSYQLLLDFPLSLVFLEPLVLSGILIGAPSGFVFWVLAYAGRPMGLRGAD